MNKIINFLKGKKTYIVGILLIVVGIIQSDERLVLEGFGLLTLRAAVSKVK